MDTSYVVETISCAEMLKQDDQWWHIYHHSFPIFELERKDAIFNCLKQQAGMSFRMKDKRTGKTIGMAHGQYLIAIQAFMLIYIAIDQPLRGQQLGRVLFNFIEDQVNQYYGPQTHHGLVLEVDRPTSFSEPEKQALAERRIIFYNDLGYKIINIDYHQPALSPECQSVPMHLMMKAADLNVQEKISLVRAIYFEKYSEQNGISAVNHQVIESTWAKVTQLNGW